MLYACPALGALVAFCMFVSPLRAVLKVDRSKHLGVSEGLPNHAAYYNTPHCIAVYMPRIQCTVCVALYYVASHWAAYNVRHLMRASVGYKWLPLPESGNSL